ncbi:MAG TPA: hypothetical protein VLK33_16500 [Terriglobales bacterium]|nr:hypothetical protein [Terriglobales bacterium]
MFTILRLNIAKWGVELVLLSLLSLPLFSADQPKTMVAPAPVPTPIKTAKRAFISNAPGTGIPANFGGPERSYNEFYAAVKSWGRYELVSNPSDADLILEISFNSSLSGVGGTSSSGPISSYSAELRLVIFDTKTRVPLWWLNEPVSPKLSFGHRPESIDSAFNRSITNLIEGLKKLVDEPGGQASSSK